eukprot:jgi/Hompol1/3482/HPOL_006560-RA
MVDALFVLGAVLVLACISFAVVYFYKLCQLPTSRYSTLLRFSCALIPATISIRWALYNLLSENDNTTSFYWLNLTSNLMMTTNMIAFVLAELEFLQVISTFLSFLSSHVVSAAKWLFATLGAIQIIVALLPHRQDGSDTNIRFIIPQITFTLITLYDICQQCLLLWFVLHFMKHRASNTFKAHFAALIILSILLAIPSICLDLITLPRSLNFLSDDSQLIKDRIQSMLTMKNQGSSLQTPSR